MASSNKTYTIEQFVESGSSVVISFNNLSYQENISTSLRLPIFNVLDDYIDDLKKMCKVVELNDEEYIKYKFKPKLLCYDIYGSAELYFIILRLNDMCDVKEFYSRRIKMLPQQTMESILTSIYNAEREFIDEYNSKTEDA